VLDLRKSPVVKKKSTKKYGIHHLQPIFQVFAHPTIPYDNMFPV
jgi:hypothetical protein